MCIYLNEDMLGLTSSRSDNYCQINFHFLRCLTSSFYSHLTVCRSHPSAFSYRLVCVCKFDVYKKEKKHDGNQKKKTAFSTKNKQTNKQAKKKGVVKIN